MSSGKIEDNANGDVADDHYNLYLVLIIYILNSGNFKPEKKHIRGSKFI